MNDEKLQALLKGANYADVARRAGVTRAYVSAIARGERLATKQYTSDKIRKALVDIEMERKNGI